MMNSPLWMYPFTFGEKHRKTLCPPIGVIEVKICDLRYVHDLLFKST
jgi:hypothetical protein